jgi:hypothetical protein
MLVTAAQRCSSGSSAERKKDVGLDGSFLTYIGLRHHCQVVMAARYRSPMVSVKSYRLKCWRGKIFF